MDKKGGLLIVSSPSNQTTLATGWDVLGSMQGSEPIPERCMLFSKRFSQITLNRRACALISLCTSATLSPLIKRWRRWLGWARILLMQAGAECNLAELTCKVR